MKDFLRLPAASNACLRGGLLLVLCLANAAAVAATEEFPSQLELSAALALSRQHNQGYNPEAIRARALREEAGAQYQRIESHNNWQARLGLEARTADRTDDGDNAFSGDSRAELNLSKRLWDFGQTEQSRRAAELAMQASDIVLLDAKRNQRIKIMRHFFDVLLADYAFAVDAETMTLGYLPYSHAQEEYERYGSVSELEVLAKQSTYLSVLTRRNQSQQQQRKARFLLALAMGLPEAKPSILIEPDLSHYQRPVPEFEGLLAQVLAQSPQLQRARLQLEQAQLLAIQTDAGTQPSLSLNLYAADFEREYTTKDRARAALVLDIPLWGHRQLTADQIEAQSKLAQLRARQIEVEQALRAQVLVWVQRLDILQQQADQLALQAQVRERQLDKARFLYEMEVQTEMGKAQVEVAKVLHQQAQVKFERALIWEQIDAALGKPIAEDKHQ